MMNKKLLKIKVKLKFLELTLDFNLMQRIRN